MIRWGYVLPRVLLLAAVAALLTWGLNPFLRWCIVRAGEQALGAKVELASVETSVRGAKLRLVDFSAADPRDPMKNLMGAESVSLDFDAEALLLRRVVVDRAVVHGLRFGESRETSGALPWQADEPSDGESMFALPQWNADHWNAIADSALESATEDLESVELIESASVRWTDRYRQIKGRLRALEQRAKDAKKRYRDPEFDRSNPLEIANFADQLNRDVAEFRREFTSLKTEIDTMPTVAAEDFRELSAAKDRDLARWRDKLKLDEINAVRLTEFLLGPELKRRTGEAMQWVERGREIAERANPPESRPVSDEVILFGDIPNPPSYLVREMRIDGWLDVEGAATPFVAQAKDLATPASRHDEPLTIQIRLQDESDIRIDATLDHRTEIADHFVAVHCPHVATSNQTLGRPEQFAILTDGGVADVRCQLRIREGQVEGWLDLRQNGVRLRPSLDERFGPRVEEGVANSLSQVNELTARIHLSGKAVSPSMRIESNLGSVVAGAMRAAFTQELAFQEERFQAKLNAELNNRMNRFNETLAERKQDLLGELNLNQQQLDQLLQLSPQLNVGRLPGGFNMNRLFSR